MDLPRASLVRSYTLEILVLKISFALVLCVTSLSATAAFAEGDAAAGEGLFKKRCQSCHAVGENAKRKSGPVLNGVVDAAAGSAEGFRYSKALMEQAEAGLVWDEASLDAFLEKPKGFLPKTKMSFAGLKSEQDRADIIAYLAQF